MKTLKCCAYGVAVACFGVVLFFTVYVSVCLIGGYETIEDEVIITGEDGRKVKYVTSSDPWFGIFKGTGPAIVPDEETE